MLQVAPRLALQPLEFLQAEALFFGEAAHPPGTRFQTVEVTEGVSLHPPLPAVLAKCLPRAEGDLASD